MSDILETPPCDIDPISIRYEGLDAAQHEIDLIQLGESLQGFGRTIAVVANFAMTGKAAVHTDALAFRVLAVPAKEHHCFEVWTTLQPIVMTKEFWAGAVVAGAGVFTSILTYILGKRNEEEMKHLSEALKQSMAGNQQVTDKLVSTIEKLADALNPSVRKALAPIERSCTSIDIYSGQQRVQSMDAETKRRFEGKGTKVADHSTVFSGVFTEFSMATGACKVQVDGLEEPIKGRVVDPVYSEPLNTYVSAYAAQVSLKFVAKYEEDGSGQIVKLHIFDTVQD